MIRHIVMWKFREGTQTQAEEFLTRLAGLAGQIECIRSMSVRRSAVSGSAYDAVLVSEFDTLEDVARYKNDPRHLAVSALCKEIRTDRCAIDEELSRLESHIAQFADTVRTAAEAGKKLDFLLQEMNREINTIGSKASDSEIAQRVVAAKCIVEKLREQVQNVV